MSIHVALHHRTAYLYDRPVNLGPQVVRLRPAPHSRTRILSYSLRALPAQHFINWQQDPQANYLARLVFPEKTSQFEIEVDLVAEMAVFNPFDFFLEPEAERMPFAYAAALDHELEPFRLKCALTPRFQALHEEIMADLRGKQGDARPRTIDFLVGVNQRLCRDIKYLIRLEPGVQAPEETLAKASGSCRDSAWLLAQLFRHSGLAARFVSGYLIQSTPDVKALDGPERRLGRFHRPPRMVRSLSARRGLDRSGPDFRPAGRRGAHSAGCHARSAKRRAHHRPGGRVRMRDRLRDERHAHPRVAARHQALHRGAMGGDRKTGPPGRCRFGTPRLPADDGRRADVRLHRRP